MRLRFDQRAGSLMFRVGDTRMKVRGGEVIEVDESVGLRILSDYRAFTLLEGGEPEKEPDVVVVADAPAEEPAIPEEPKPEPTVTSTGAVSVNDLGSGGRRGRRKRS